jgi:hypothetical protein
MTYQTKFIALCVLWLITVILLAVDRIAPQKTTNFHTAISSGVLVGTLALTWHVVFTYWL